MGININAYPMMWFGTRDYMQFIKHPQVSMPSASVGWNNTASFLSGGSANRSSTSSHKEYEMNWENASRSDVRPVTDYADKLYGEGPFYWADPFTMDANALPQYAASPFQNADDGPFIDDTEARPTLTATVANTLGYPTRSAVYTLSGAAFNAIWIPCPPGYTVWLGAHGVTGSGGNVVATPTTGPTTTGTAVNLILLPVTSTTRVNQSFDSTSYSGVLVSLGGSGTITLSGLMAQILPTGQTPATGGFISGQGQSGCAFDGNPVLEPYNSAYDQVSLSVKLVEVSAWL